MPGVDVVIPNYQYGRYLRGCVESVLAQDVEALRVLVIDNASTDDSVEIARELARRDRRVEVLARPKNLGPHSSFNEGVDWASAEYFMILCADDLLAPGALARAVGIMRREPDVHVAYGRTVHWFDSQSAAPKIEIENRERAWSIVPGIEFIKRCCRSGGKNPVDGPTAVVRTAVQKKVGYYRPSVPHADDLELWLRFGLHGAFAETKAVQYYMRDHATNNSNAVGNWFAWDRENAIALDSFFANEGSALPGWERLYGVARHNLAERAYWASWKQRLRGNTELGGDMRDFAVQLCPEMAVRPPLGSLLRRKLGLGAARFGDATRSVLTT